MGLKGGFGTFSGRDDDLFVGLVSDISSGEEAWKGCHLVSVSDDLALLIHVNESFDKI